LDGPYLIAQDLASVGRLELFMASSSDSMDTKDAGADADVSPTAGKIEEIIDRFLEREHVVIQVIEGSAPIIETYIQEIKPDKQLGIVPKTDIYFLGQADFRRRLKAHSSIAHGKKSSLWWSYDPAGFLRMIFVDRREFNRAHYKLKYVRKEFLGEVRCFVFDVAPAEKVRGARFTGRIWVEDQDFNIIRINGVYTPAVRFSFRSLEDED
jgi:hypothetical protein